MSTLRTPSLRSLGQRTLALAAACLFFAVPASSDPSLFYSLDGIDPGGAPELDGEGSELDELHTIQLWLNSNPGSEKGYAPEPNILKCN